MKTAPASRQASKCPRGALALLVLAAPARAGGLTLPTNGMHSTERAGALVAGADEADALFLDPAGLARIAGDGHRSLMFDVGYLYEPQTYSAPNTPEVSNQQPGTPQFAIAGALGIGDRLVIAGGITTLSAGVHHFNDTGQQAYASTEVRGTQFVNVVVGAAYVVSPQLRVGATLENMVSMLDWSVIGTACKAEPCGAGFDLPLHLTQNDYIAPSGSIGVQYAALPELTLGAMIHAPTKIASQGTLIVTPPTSPAFTGMTVTGNQASASFWLPPSLRAGAEWRHLNFRVEAAVDLELWGIHDQIAIAPQGISIGAVTLGEMQIARDYHTSIAASLGGEARFGEVRLAAGIGYETSAAPARTAKQPRGASRRCAGRGRSRSA